MTRITLLLLVVCLLSGCASVADRMARGVERGAERAAEREASRQADRAVTGVMRTAENAVICLVTDAECIRAARERGEAVEVRDADGNVVEQYPAPGDGVDVNNAFAAGAEVLFYEDYADDPVGDFPRGLEFVSGNWEVATWNGRRLLRNTGPRNSAFRVILPDALPDTFTVETELHFSGSQRVVVLTQPPSVSLSQIDYNWVQVTHEGSQRSGVAANAAAGLPTSMNQASGVDSGLVPLQILVEGDDVKVFVAGDRVGSVPNAFLPRSEALHVVLPEAGSEDRPVYLGPIRVAAPRAE